MQEQRRKILVSHSGRQYVHQLLYALQSNNFNYHFITSFWYKPNSFPFTLTKLFPQGIRTKVEKELRKRSFDKLDVRNVSYFPWFEFVREVADKLVSYRVAEYLLFWRDRIHDYWAASKVSKQYDVVVGYEECSLHTFRKAKQLGLTTVLDLAQIHNKEITAISNQFPYFSEIYQNKNLRKRINAIKDEEMALTDHILCLSEFAKASLVKHGVPAEKVTVVNLGFDPMKFKPKEVYATEGKLKLVYAGTITKRKGIDQMLSLLDEMSDKVEVIFIGPMADADDLFAKYEGRFTWHPYLEQDEMNTVFNQSDIFVFPSYLDSWAMVVIEGMACGLPVIISANTGAKDAVADGCGFIIEAGNFQVLKEKIAYFYNYRDQLYAMGRQSVVSAQSYTWDKYYQQITTFFDKI